MGIERIRWPQNKVCAAMISVNLDAEFFAKIYYPDVEVEEGDILRLGRTGIRFGLPHLLEVLDRYQLKATFFIPGQVAKRYPDAVRAIAAHGHEIGCHGNHHEILAHMTGDEQRALLTDNGADAGRISHAGRGNYGGNLIDREISWIYILQLAVRRRRALYPSAGRDCRTAGPLGVIRPSLLCIYL